MGGGDNGGESGITGEIEMVMGEEGMPGQGRRTAYLCGIVIRGVIGTGRVGIAKIGYGRSGTRRDTCL